MWSFFMMLACLAIGSMLLATVVFCIAMTVYVLPFLTWYGWNSGTKGIPRKSPSSNLPAFKSMCHTAKNASKLYRSWITHTPHNITNW